MEGATGRARQKTRLKSARSNKQRVLVDSATEMNAAANGLFVDFQLVDNSVKN